MNFLYKSFAYLKKILIFEADFKKEIQKVFL